MTDGGLAGQARTTTLFSGAVPQRSSGVVWPRHEGASAASASAAAATARPRQRIPRRGDMRRLLSSDKTAQNRSACREVCARFSRARDDGLLVRQDSLCKPPRNCLRPPAPILRALPTRHARRLAV